MPLVDIDVNDALKGAFGGDVSDEEYLFDDGDDDDSDDSDEEDFVEAETDQASSTEQPLNGGELPLTADQTFDDENEVKDEDEVEDENGAEDEHEARDETQSHFSDTSSDEDGWDATDALQKFRAMTEAMKLRKRVEETPESTTGDADSELDEVEHEDAAGEIKIDPANEDSENNTEAAVIEPSAEETVVYEVDENKKPWLRYAHLNGAILPIAAHGDDDLYRRDATFFRTGRYDPTRGAGPVGLSRDKPTKMSIDGVIRRIQLQRDEARNQRNELWYESKELKAELKNDGEEIGMLKHAVDTRDEQLTKLKAAVEGWKQRSEQWEKAFEQQQPLANSERERQMMIKAGIEFSRSVETQTSPVEQQIADQLRISNSDLDDVLALRRERDSLLEENKELSDQTRRLRSLLEDTKEWIENQSWVPKDPVKEENTGAYGQSRPTVNVSEPSSDSSIPGSENGFSDPLPSFNWAAQHRPERWIEREQALRKSASWIQAKDDCAAQLDAWEKQFWANANTKAVVCG